MAEKELDRMDSSCFPQFLQSSLPSVTLAATTAIPCQTHFEGPQGQVTVTFVVQVGSPPKYHIECMEVESLWKLDDAGEVLLYSQPSRLTIESNRKVSNSRDA